MNHTPRRPQMPQRLSNVARPSAPNGHGAKSAAVREAAIMALLTKKSIALAGERCGVIAAFCDHPGRFGVVESVNTTIKAVLRRSPGMRDEAMLLLKLKSATAHPISIRSRLEALPD